RTAEDCFGKDGVVLSNERVVSHIRVTDDRANRQAAIGKRFDLVQWQPIDVDQRLRLFHIQLHEIDQCCPTADEANLRSLLSCARLSRTGDSLSAIAGSRELKSFHPVFCGLAFCRTL